MYSYSEDDHGADAELIAWCLELEEQVLAQSADDRTRLQFRSTETMLTALGIDADVELVWIDTAATLS